ncbi:MAG TPA: peptidase [Elusimicrobia bacterium]|nr:peptidase [Elusimicrobiota bacterium]
MGRMSAPSFRLLPALLTGLALLGGPAAAFEVRVLPESPVPGDILRVSVTGSNAPSRFSATLDGTVYRLHPDGAGGLRALIGLTAQDPPGWRSLLIVRRRALLPDQRRTAGFLVGKRTFAHQRLRMRRSKAKLLEDPEARDALLKIRAVLALESDLQLWEGTFVRPAAGRKTSSYGLRRTINKDVPWDWHKGLDFAAAEGSPILAPNSGRVLLAGRFPLQGGTVLIDHGQGLVSALLHLKSFSVRAGDTVRKGQRIAEAGGGGLSTGSHLHWGVYVHGAPVDPEPLLGRAP